MHRRDDLITLGGWTEMLYCDAVKQHRLSKPLVVEHGEIARRAPPNNFFLHAATTVSCILQFAACSSHGRKIVDLYICEQFGHLLVTVGQFANPIAEYGLLKMLRSRCFATIIQRPISRTAHCSRNAIRSYRLLWNECAQLTLISARDFNVTDASRTMRALF